MKLKQLILLALVLFGSCVLDVHSQGTLSETKFPNLQKPVLTSNDSLKSLTELRNEIEKLLDDRHLSTSKYGILIKSLSTGKQIFTRNAHQVLTPASNTKLFTTLGAVHTMGWNHQVRTSIYTDTANIVNGVLQGDIYIYGRGDALLSINDLESLADMLVSKGIKRIKGNVYADGTFYDNVTNRRAYSGDADEVQATPPITSLSLERNAITILVKSGSRAGSDVNVQVLPSSDAISIINQAKVSTARGAKIRVASKMVDGIQQFTITGTLNPNRTSYHSYYMNRPELIIAGALKDRLIISGIIVDGEAKEKSLPANLKPILLAEFERHLIHIIMPVNKNSDNYLAETLYKMIGGYYGNNQNSGKAASTIIMNVLDSLGIDRSNFRINDGSGLSRRNLVNAESLVRILENEKSGLFKNALDSTLSIAGNDGTLRRRMSSTLAEGNLRAKTGTLRNVSTLAGYVNTLDNELFCFAFIFNGPNVNHYKQIENSLGELLSNFFYYHEIR